VTTATAAERHQDSRNSELGRRAVFSAGDFDQPRGHVRNGNPQRAPRRRTREVGKHEQHRRDVFDSGELLPVHRREMRKPRNTPEQRETAKGNIQMTHAASTPDQGPQAIARPPRLPAEGARCKDTRATLTFIRPRSFHRWGTSNIHTPPSGEIAKQPNGHSRPATWAGIRRKRIKCGRVDRSLRRELESPSIVRQIPCLDSHAHLGIDK